MSLPACEHAGSCYFIATNRFESFDVLIDSGETAMLVACKYRAVIAVAVCAIVLSSLEVDAQR